MKRLQILMPMGGLGSRFAKQGYTTPKPLIPVDGKPMFMRALDSFEKLDDIELHYLFVIRRDQESAYNLSSQIKQHLPDAKITILEQDTRGAVETCMLAKDSIDNTAPIVVADCDIYFKSQDYIDKVHQSIALGKPDGMLLTFTSNDPRYSYAEINDRGEVIRTAEKVVISDHAILGGYFFQSGKLFKDLSQEFISQELPEGLKEYFMSHLFNLLLAKNGSIAIADVDTMYIFGTPEELEAYKALQGN